MPEMQTIEINGIKMEVDMRHAKRIDTYRVGDRVRVLVKDPYSKYRVYPGVIVAFDHFSKRPGIQVAYVDMSYMKAELKLITYNTDTEDVEIAPDLDSPVELDKGEVTKCLNREIETKQREIEALEQKKQYFLDRFGVYFGEALASGE